MLLLHGHDALFEVSNPVFESTSVKTIQILCLRRFVAVLASLCVVGALWICIVTLPKTYEWQHAK
jgi:hypothetical protein